MALSWRGATLTGWLGEIQAGSLEEQQLLGSSDEAYATSKSWMDGADCSDAEQQSSTVLRKRYCDDLIELESDCWAQEQQQARQQSQLLKRVCSGLTSTSCEAGSTQPCWPHAEEQQPHSEPCSPGDACPSEASAPHCSAAAAGAKQEQGADTQPQQGKASTRASSSRSAAAKAAAASQDSVPAASSRASSRRATRKPSDSASASHTNKFGGCLRSSTASRVGSGSSSGSSACKVPRVRLGGRLLSPEEAEKHLREVAALAQLAAAKAAAAKAAAAAAAAGYAAAASEPAVVVAEPELLGRPASPSLDAVAAAPTADDGSMHQAAVLAAGLEAKATCSPVLLSSAHGSSGCQQDTQAAAAAAGSADYQQQQQQQVLACKLEPMAADCAAAGQPDLGCSSSALQQQDAAALAAMDALGVDVDEDDLDLSMLPDQLADQLAEDFVPTPHNSSGWPSLESTLGGLDIPAAAAAAAEAALIGSACSAAGCNADSLTAAVQEEEAAQQQQQLGFVSSPFLMSGSYSAAPGTMAYPSSSHDAVAAFRSMRSREDSSASLCETALLHRGSYSSSMSSSSLAKSCSMPIRLPQARPDSISLPGPSGPDAISLAHTPSACLSALPGFVSSSSMAVNMSCDSLSSMHGGCAAVPAHDPAVAIAQQEADCLDAELQQLLAQWSPVESSAAAAAAAGAVLPHHASSAPAACSAFSQQLSCSSPQQQMSMPLSLPLQGEHADIGVGGRSTAALPSMVSGAAAGFVGFAGPNQQAPSQLAWKSAFAPAAPAASSSGALSVSVPISVPAAGCALSLQCGAAFATSFSAMQGTATAPVQIAYPAGRQPRARKGKGSGSKASQQQIKKQLHHHQQQQQQLTMQLQVPASALPAAVPPGAHVVLHLKPNQQQQLMAVVDRLVQQRLAQTYEAGYRAATQNISSSMGTGSMLPPPPVQQHPQVQMQLTAGLDSTQMASGDIGSRSMSMAVPAGSPSPEMPSQPAFAAAAAAAGTLLPRIMEAGVAGAPQLVLPSVPRPSQLVDDILPSMQDLLTDCYE